MLTSVIIITLSLFVPLYEASIVTVIGHFRETVILPCSYDVETHGILNICWGRGQSWFDCENTLISTDGLSVNFRQSYKYSLPSMLQNGDASLTIKMAQEADAGFYVCRIEIPGLFNDLSYTVFLIVTSDPVNIITATELIVSAVNNVGTQGVTAEYPSVNSVAQLVKPEDTPESFIPTALRVGAVIFIPGLIIGLIWKLQRSREHTDSSGKENAPTQQQNNVSPQS